MIINILLFLSHTKGPSKWPPGRHTQGGRCTTLGGAGLRPQPCNVAMPHSTWPPRRDGRGLGPINMRGRAVAGGTRGDRRSAGFAVQLPPRGGAARRVLAGMNEASAITAPTPASFPLPPSGRQGHASTAGCPEVVTYGSSWWAERGAVRKLEFTGGVGGRNAGSEQRNGGS